MNPLRIAVILPGLGRVQRGAETAFLEIAGELNRQPDVSVQLFGSGTDVPDGLPITTVECVPRERFEGWLKLPCFRSECHYEEAGFAYRLWREGVFQPAAFDVTISCTYPWLNWLLQRAKRRNPDLTNLFVTQNGDWMCHAGHREYRYFGCDGLVAINPDYQARCEQLHRSALIGNGTDPNVFFPGDRRDSTFASQIPQDKTVVLMASAMITSKRVADGVRAVAELPDTFLVVAGDGPERDNVTELARELLPERHLLLGSIPRTQMAELYRSADIFLHLSRIEPFGIVYLEAAATGLPIVTHDHPTPRWILDDCALFADCEQEGELVAALRQATDPAVQQKLGSDARRRVIEHWTWKAQALKYLDFIYSLKNITPPTSSDNHEDAIDHHCELQHV